MAGGEAANLHRRCLRTSFPSCCPMLKIRRCWSDTRPATMRPSTGITTNRAWSPPPISSCPSWAIPTITAALRPPMRRDGGVHRGRRRPLGPHVDLEASQIFRRRPVWRAVEKGREVPHRADVSSLSVGRKTAHRRVLDHATPQRADGSLCHGLAPVLSEVRNPKSQHRTDQPRYHAELARR